MPRSIQTLPDGYEQVYGIDLATNKTLSLLLNLVGTGVLFLTLWLLAIFATLVHPEFSATSYNLAFRLVDMLYLLLLVAVSMVLHEMLHGIFFWLYTRSRPVFGLRLTYAYAGAPGWYIPRSQYWSIGLAPLLLIGMAGLLVIAFGPPACMLPAAVMTGFNTGGAVGDMWVIYRLLRASPACLVNDTGHSIYFYQPVKSSG